VRSDVINGGFRHIRLSWDVETCGKFGCNAPIFRIRQFEKAVLLGPEGGNITPPHNFSISIYQLTRSNITETLNFETCKFFDQTSSDSVVAGTYSVSDSVLEFSLGADWRDFIVLVYLDMFLVPFFESQYLNLMF
jgi:hypothetical protein